MGAHDGAPGDSWAPITALMMALRALMMALMGTQTAKQMGPKREGEYHDSASRFG